MAERFTVEHGGPSVTDLLINKLRSIGRHLNPKSNDLACIPFRHKSRPKITEAEFLILICSTFPDDFRIPIQDLVSYGMSLDLFEDVHDMFSTRCRIHDIISNINDKNYSRKAVGGQIRLALEKDGPLDQYIKMLVGSRDVAKSIILKYALAYRQEIVTGKWPESDWCEDCYGLSLVLKKVNAYPSNLEFPKLTLLRLQYREDSQSIPIDFFQSMKELCVLSLDVPSLPHSLNFLTSLKTLRLKVPRLEDMSWIGALINLEFLTLRVSSLADIPRELGQLQNLRLLDLRKMNIAYIPPGVLSRLLKLEELYFPLNFRKWGCKASKCDDYNEWESREEDNKEFEGRVNANIDSEIVSLSLNALQICVPEASFLPNSSEIFKNIREFNIFVPHSAVYQPFGKYSVNVLQITGEAFDIKESGICDLLSKAEELSLTRVRNLRNVIYQLAEGFQQLQKMIISECNELEFVVDTTRREILSEGDSLFRKLECLHLSMLSSLKEICHGRWTNLSSFSNLSQVSIRFCPKLTYAFPLSIVRGLTLKSIEILDCHEMEGIYYEDEDNIPLIHGSIEKLELHSLPRLISFSVRKDDKIDGVENGIAQSLTSNEVSVTKYKVVVSHMEMEMYSAFSSRFAVKWFQNLKSLKIAYCDMVQVVFLFEKNHATSKAFNSLEVLELHGLQNLVHIWFQIPPKRTSFKNLRLLVLTECGGLYLFSYQVAKLLVQLQKVYVSRCEKMEEIVIGRDAGSEEKGRLVLPKLKLLELQNMPNLQILFGVSFEIELPLLESLKLKDCNKMKSFSDGLLNMPMLEGVEVNGSFYLVSKDYNIIFTGVTTPHKFTFADLKIATKDFSSDNCLGKGSFGEVYKGWIDRKTYAPSKTGTGMLVAVKRYNNLEGMSYSYRRDCAKREVRMLERRSHPNLVKLLGHCLEDKEAAVVYEFVPGGTLYDLLFSKKTMFEPLPWDMRIKIAIGAAQGINYLHTSEPKVIHRDIKPHNILLDTDLNPKISALDLAISGSSDYESHGMPMDYSLNFKGKMFDFELAEMIRLGSTNYTAPENGVSGRVSVKADVYSFGVVLFELMTGSKAFIDWMDATAGTTLGASLESSLARYKDVKDLIVAWMRGQQGSSEAKLLMADLIMDCTKLDPELRPTMAQVLYRLCEIDAINGPTLWGELSYQLYLDEKLNLQNFMKSNCESVCLSTEVWNSPNGITYTGITAHFIDEDWMLQRKVLSFFPNDYRGKEIWDFIEEWGIKKVCTITMDNTKTNDNGISYLKEELMDRGIGFSGCKYLEVKCIVRVINSVVVEVLEKAKLSVDRVRNAVDYVKYCPNMLKKFKECIAAEKIESMDQLLLDFCPMWNFTYVMLSRAEKYEKAFDRFAEFNPDFKLPIGYCLPSSVDWSVVRQLTIVLKPFYDIVSNILKSSNLTSNNFWVDISDLYAIFSEWQNGDDLELRAIAEEMRLKLEDYFGGYEKTNKLVYIAAVLDPRCKYKVLEYSFDQIYGEEKGVALYKDVKEAMLELFNEYKSTVQHKAVDRSKLGSNGPTEERKKIFMALFGKQKLESVDVKPELEVYLNEPIEADEDDFDVLEWWKCNAEKFPVLSAMARDILAIPESGVRRDFIFNTNERMLEGYKCYLDCEVLEAMMCGQDWLGGPPPKGDAIKEYDEDEASKEELMEAEIMSSLGEWRDSDCHIVDMTCSNFSVH